MRTVSCPACRVRARQPGCRARAGPPYSPAGMPYSPARDRRPDTRRPARRTHRPAARPGRPDPACPGPSQPGQSRPGLSRPGRGWRSPWPAPPAASAACGPRRPGRRQARARPCPAVRRGLPGPCPGRGRRRRDRGGQRGPARPAAPDGPAPAGSARSPVSAMPSAAPAPAAPAPAAPALALAAALPWPAAAAAAAGAAAELMPGSASTATAATASSSRSSAASWPVSSMPDAEAAAARRQPECLGPPASRRGDLGQRMTVERGGPAAGRLGELKRPAGRRGRRARDSHRAGAQRHDLAAGLDDPYPGREVNQPPQRERRRRAHRPQPGHAVEHPGQRGVDRAGISTKPMSNCASVLPWSTASPPSGATRVATASPSACWAAGTGASSGSARDGPVPRSTA